MTINPNTVFYLEGVDHYTRAVHARAVQCVLLIKAEDPNAGLLIEVWMGKAGILWALWNEFNKKQLTDAGYDVALLGRFA